MGQPKEGKGRSDTENIFCFFIWGGTFHQPTSTSSWHSSLQKLMRRSLTTKSELLGFWGSYPVYVFRCIQTHRFSGIYLEHRIVSQNMTYKWLLHHKANKHKTKQTKNTTKSKKTNKQPNEKTWTKQNKHHTTPTPTPQKQIEKSANRNITLLLWDKVISLIGHKLQTARVLSQLSWNLKPD